LRVQDHCAKLRGEPLLFQLEFNQGGEPTRERQLRIDARATGSRTMRRSGFDGQRFKLTGPGSASVASRPRFDNRSLTGSGSVSEPRLSARGLPQPFLPVYLVGI
jgi:hypothetical protein